MVRHGESVWNKRNVFNGWVDVPLSKNGITEAISAGEQLADIPFDVVYTSIQVRAIETTMILLAQSNIDRTPVIIHQLTEEEIPELEIPTGKPLIYRFHEGKLEQIHTS